MPPAPSNPVAYPGTAIEDPVSDGGLLLSPVTAGGAGSHLKADGTNGIFSASGYAGAYPNIILPQDQETFMLPPNDSFSDNYLYVRIDPATIGVNINSYAAHWLGSGSSLIDIFKYTAGANSLLKSVDTAEPFSIIRKQICIRAVGSRIGVWYDGTLLGYYDDPSYLAPGYVGFDTNATVTGGFLNWGWGAVGPDPVTKLNLVYDRVNPRRRVGLT